MGSHRVGYLLLGVRNYLCGSCGLRRIIHQTVLTGLNLVGSLIILLHIRILLELLRGFAHDILDLRGEHRIGITTGHHHEDARTQHVVEVLDDEVGHQTILLLCQTSGLCSQCAVNDILIDAVEKHLTLLVRQFIHLVTKLVMTIDELIQFIIQRCTTDATACIIDADFNLALLHYHRHRKRLIIHIKVCQLHCIKQSGKTEFTMHDITGIHALQFLILHRLQIEFTSIK